MSFALIEYIETPRLVLSCPYPGDGEALYVAVAESLSALRLWPDSLPWAQKPQSAERTENYCQSCFGAFVMGLAWPMLMVDKATGTLVGSVGFHRIDPSVPEFELGYWCRSSYQGRGLMSEAVAALSDCALLQVTKLRLVCRVDVRNAASCRVVEKAKYVFKQSVRETLQDARPTVAVRIYERWSVPQTEQVA